MNTITPHFIHFTTWTNFGQIQRDFGSGKEKGNVGRCKIRCPRIWWCSPFWVVGQPIIYCSLCRIRTGIRSGPVETIPSLRKSEMEIVSQYFFPKLYNIHSQFQSRPRRRDTKSTVLLDYHVHIKMKGIQSRRTSWFGSWPPGSSSGPVTVPGYVDHTVPWDSESLCQDHHAFWTHPIRVNCQALRRSRNA